MKKPIIRIVKASTGLYLYKLMNPTDLNISHWRGRYWCLNMHVIEMLIDDYKK